MSASRTPTRLPFRDMATASMEVTVDLPTPPLPDTTAITFFTLAFSFSFARRLSAFRSPQSELEQEAQFPLQELMLKTLLYQNLGYYKSVFPRCQWALQPLLGCLPLLHQVVEQVLRLFLLGD